MPSDDSPPPAASRRQFLVGGAAAGAVGLLAGAAGGYAAGAASAGSTRPDDVAATPASTTVDPHGPHQAGIDRPAVLQRHLELAVLDVDGVSLADALDRAGRRIASLASGTDAALGGLDPARLTVTVAVSDRVLALLRPDAGAAGALPAFRRDEIPAERAGGDVLVLARSDDGAVAALSRAAVCDEVRGTVRWTTTGFTSAPDGPATRNIIGFHDGISLPRTDAERAASVWIAEGPLAGGAVTVVRVMPVDTAAFTALAVGVQERAVGRERSTGVPLSGGKPDDGPDLAAKSASGVYDIPVDAHVRRAHPLPAGLDGLMLRRSYAYSAGPRDQGSVFISFQRELDFFARTQARLDEQDALLAHTRTTASGVFTALPGYTAEEPLGTVLRA